MNLEEKKQALRAYRDLWGGSLVSSDEIDNVQSNEEIGAMLDRHEAFMECQLSDALSNLSEFRNSLRLWYDPNAADQPTAFPEPVVIYQNDKHIVAVLDFEHFNKFVQTELIWKVEGIENQIDQSDMRDILVTLPFPEQTPWVNFFMLLRNADIDTDEVVIFTKPL